jgi:signal transduction histidine kinase/CHASE3 domain sensor protein
MREKEINKIFGLSIGRKITLGFIFISTVFLILSLFTLQNIERANHSLDSLRELSIASVQVLDIDKNISELQKSALVYSQTGSSSVIQKMKKTYQEIKDNLNSILNQSSFELQENKDLLREMKNVVNRYGENITSLSQRYEYRQKLLEVDFPELIDSGSKHLKSIISHEKKLRKTNKTIIAQEMLLLWLESSFHAQSYIKERKYSLKNIVKNKITKLKLLNTSLEDTSSTQYEKNKHNQFVKTISTFQGIFEQSIQANRIYLSLINVVMAGEAFEFSTLSKNLRVNALRQLESISRQSVEVTRYNKKVTIITFALFIPLILLLALFYNKNISHAIKDISNTFSGLLEGEYNRDVPGLTRKDEIGQLAKAANAFKEVGLQYREAKIVAEQSTRIKSEFLANMSHEIRTPMNGILGMVSLLQETPITLEQKKMLETISSCGDGLLTVLNDILDFSKIESGSIKLENRPFSLNECLNEVSYLFSTKASEKGIGFSCNIVTPNTPEIISGDITRVKQILINLASNAIKFTSLGEVTIQVKSSLVNEQDVSFRQPCVI